MRYWPMKWLGQSMLWRCIYTHLRSGSNGRMVALTRRTVVEAAGLFSGIILTLLTVRRAIWV